MESKDVIKALECCNKYPDLYCHKCPFEDKPEYCLKLSKHALELIKNQQAEIEKLKKANGLFEYLNMAVYRQTDIPFEFKTIEAKNDAIRKMIDKLCNIQTAKTEAYKEFEKRVIENICAYYKDEQCVSVGTIKGFIYISSKELSSKELTERKED